MMYISSKDEQKRKMLGRHNIKRFMKNKYIIINPITNRNHSKLYLLSKK